MEKKEESMEVDSHLKEEFEEFVQALEQQKDWIGKCLVKYEGFWVLKKFLQPILSCRKYFTANDNDIVLATMPKAGTTWLKALTLSIVNRNVYTIDQSPLLNSNPHKLVPYLELEVYMEQENPDLQHIPCPRVFSTHMPFKVLPQSILQSECKIIHICRNPLDQFLSYYHFSLENKFDTDVPLELDKAFDMFCQGIYSYGPCWEQIHEYWNASLNKPKKVLFLRYEDLQEDIIYHVRKIAKFLECPFSEEEENQGLVEKISSLCSFEKLSNLSVNKSGVTLMTKNASFFRKGKVGDWINYLTPQMAQRMKKILDDKLLGTGLTWKI